MEPCNCTDVKVPQLKEKLAPYLVRIDQRDKNQIRKTSCGLFSSNMCAQQGHCEKNVIYIEAKSCIGTGAVLLWKMTPLTLNGLVQL